MRKILNQEKLIFSQIIIDILKAALYSLDRLKI